ncbi:MAG: hypothetical protein HXO29_09970, partial [Prevotella sp.]|nr:hypothetical protein [Prevotella sp.]
MIIIKKTASPPNPLSERRGGVLDIICLGIIKDLPSTNLFRSEEMIYIYLDMSRIYPYYIFLGVRKASPPNPLSERRGGVLDTICLGIIKDLPSTNLFKSEERLSPTIGVSW